MQGVGYYVILLNERTHLCSCLLLINKGLICHHFFWVGTYSQNATFHISMIPSRWYLDTNIQANDLLQHYLPVPVCGITETDNAVEMKKNVNFQHLISLCVDLHSSQSVVKSNKAIYTKLFGLSRKAIDCALKVDMQHELLRLLKPLFMTRRIRMFKKRKELILIIQLL